MTKTLILFGILVALMNDTYAETSMSGQCTPDKAIEQEASSINSDFDLPQDVDDALNALQAEAPDVHRDSLRVWKNYKTGAKTNFAYRSWGRRLIEWIQTNKKRVFNSQEEFEKVFLILWHKKLISKDAVSVLTTDTWGHKLYEEGGESFGGSRKTDQGLAVDALKPKSQEMSL